MPEGLGVARATWRAMPTLLRVGVAETIAYRAEFVIWMLTTTLPLVMLGLWASVAGAGTFRGYSADAFVAYYLATLIVRNLTGSWVVWQINDEIRRGVLSMRLLRPIHPFASFVGTHLSAVPLRAIIALPVATYLLVTGATHGLPHEPATIALLALGLVGAWVLTFFTLIAIGSLAFFVEKSMALFEVYLGVFAVMSGYLLPLPLLPSWLASIARYAPFRYMLSAPVELMVGGVSTTHALELVAVQWAWAAGAVLSAGVLWNAGVKRFEAYGA